MRGLNRMGVDKKLPFLSYSPLVSVESSLDGSKFPYRVWESSANVKRLCLVFFGMEAGPMLL